VADLEWVDTEPLRAEHDRSSFSSGVPVMDRYLREQAGQDQKRGLAIVYVSTAQDSARVIGYYTLSALSLALGDWPVAVQKKLPRYPWIPATLLGRLAVDQNARRAGLRVGERLLMDALAKALHASKVVASYAVVVDVLDVEPDPLDFYLRYGFQPLPDHPRRLYLAMETIRRSFSA